MDNRAQNILNAVIDSYIKTGNPVSSGWLYEKYNFGIKPAMIRHELENLTSQGLLEQPYHSAGRIPSDKAFEIFANQILAAEEQSELDKDFIRPLRNSNWPQFTSLLSESFGILSALEEESEDRLYKSGLEVLLDNLNWENQNNIKSIIRDFEELDRRIADVKNKIHDIFEPQVFIGSKSPITESRDLAVIAQKCLFDGENIFLVVIGPKRMNYKKVVKTFKGIKNENERRK